MRAFPISAALQLAALVALLAWAPVFLSTDCLAQEPLEAMDLSSVTQ